MAETDVKGLIEEARESIRQSIRNHSHYVLSDQQIDDIAKERPTWQALEALAALSGTREAGEPVAMTDDQIIELAVCHSNYKESAEHEVFSHRRLIEFARALLSAAPPAEVERGAVTDEMVERGTVEAASLIPNFGRYVDADDVRSIIEAALASPAPQPAVEAQGVESETLRLQNEWDNCDEMLQATRAALASEKARADRAERERDELRKEAGELVVAQYAISALEARIGHLNAGLNDLVNCQSSLTRAQMREAAADVLRGAGMRTTSTEDKSPFVARAEAAEAAHDATCNVLADTERRRMNAEVELAKLRGALLEISSMQLAEGEDDDREGLSALLSRIRVRALRPTASEEGKTG